MNQKQNLLFTDSDCNGSPNGQPPLLQDISLPKVKFRRVLKRLPSDIPYLPLTCENGTRLYLRLKEQNYSDDDSDEYENIPVSHIKTGNDIIANWNQTRAEANVLVKLILCTFHKNLLDIIAFILLLLPSFKRCTPPNLNTLTIMMTLVALIVQNIVEAFSGLTSIKPEIFWIY